MHSAASSLTVYCDYKQPKEMLRISANHQRDIDKYEARKLLKANQSSVKGQIIKVSLFLTAFD